MDSVHIRTIPVRNNVYMLMGSGGNIGVSVGEDGVLLIDAEYAPLSEKIKAAVAALSPKPIRFLLNTHWHGDHTGGNANFGKEGVTIIAHDNIRKRLSTDQFNELFNWKTPASPPAALPVITFSDSITLHLNGDEIHFVHVDTAHTDGDAIAHFVNANVIQTGDLIFSEGFPFIDLASGGSVDGYIAADRKILAMANDQTLIIPGHGHLTNEKELETYLNMITIIHDNILNQVKAGKTKDEVLASKPTKDYDAVWGKGFMKPDVFVGIVYQSLAGTKK
jgi:glyoxylase-like metal-dependent hydrolase (beta-lactamase superfamily II)